MYVYASASKHAHGTDLHDIDVNLPRKGAPKAAGRGQTLIRNGIAEPEAPQTGL